jgi:hypothetical protein
LRAVVSAVNRALGASEAEDADNGGEG